MVFRIARPRPGETLCAALLGAALVLLPVGLSPARADETLVAVAANFTATAKEIGTAFEAATGHTVKFSFGSTGKLYAQIANGAPFQAFLAADAARPEKAEAEGLAVPGSRFTYAVGRLVLYSIDPELVDEAGAVLNDGDFKRLAIANPVTAPYGAAAVEVLNALNLKESLSDKLVQGDNIAQTLQFVTTGNAELGMLALSQVIGMDDGSRWDIPADLYQPIRQDAVLLKTGENSDATKAFLAFLKDPEATAIIANYGYGTE